MRLRHAYRTRTHVINISIKRFTLTIKRRRKKISLTSSLYFQAGDDVTWRVPKAAGEGGPTVVESGDQQPVGSGAPVGHGNHVGKNPLAQSQLDSVSGQRGAVVVDQAGDRHGRAHGHHRTGCVDTGAPSPVVP